MMKTPRTTFAAVYAEVLNAGWSMIPGGSLAAQAPSPAPELTPKAAQVEAEQEWEHEGGSIVPPEKKPELESGPKIPF